jgi:hypothetical protein
MPESPHQEDEMAKTHLEDRKSYVHKSTCQEVEKDKTYFEDVHVPDDKDQQTPHRMLTLPDSTHQEDGEYETYCEDGYNAMHVEGRPPKRYPPSTRSPSRRPCRRRYISYDAKKS